MRKIFDETATRDWTKDEMLAAKDSLVESCWEQHGGLDEDPDEEVSDGADTLSLGHKSQDLEEIVRCL